MKSVNPQLEDHVNSVDYDYLNNEYIPSIEALEFMAFIKLVNGAAGEANKSPVIHLNMLDEFIHSTKPFLAVVFRGGAKTTVLHEYAFLYLATYGTWFHHGDISVAMYVSDTIDNGVKSMRKQLEYRWQNSEFLQEFVPNAHFNANEWEFINKDGHKLFVQGFGAATGVRGFKRYGKRPQWCGFDDLMSDKNAQSPTILNDIENVLYSAARQALDPDSRIIVWTGTPFSKADSLYKAAGSKGWHTKAYPICEKFPVSREEFRGAWEDRFSYDFLLSEYEQLRDSGKLHAFNQELMLRVASDEERLVPAEQLNWYKRETLLMNPSIYNFYITTDFATSERDSADYSVISVWALNNKGYWFLVDGICERQRMDANIDDLFRLCQRYKPKSVGVEVSGQQGGFIDWIKREMMNRNVWFNLASDKGSKKEGIRPKGNKLTRFQLVQPWFAAGMMYFPEEFRNSHPLMVEIEDELSVLTAGGFKSLHDDACDTISMLANMPQWRPSDAVEEAHQDKNGIWDFSPEEDSPTVGAINSYLV